MDWSVVFITFPSVDGHTYRLVEVPLMNKLPDVNLNDVFFSSGYFFASLILTLALYRPSSPYSAWHLDWPEPPSVSCSCPCLSLLCYPPFPHSCLFLPCLPGEKVKFRRNWYLLSLFDRLLFIVFLYAVLYPLNFSIQVNFPNVDMNVIWKKKKKR